MKRVPVGQDDFDWTATRSSDADEAPPPGNDDVEHCLREIADLLESHGANPFRVRAYRQAADTIDKLTIPVADLFEQQGVDGLKKLPGIGQSLAGAIRALVESGRMPLLERLRGETTAEDVFTTLPGIGAELAKRIHDALQIETLGELQAAAIDGRLARVEGMGRKRVQAVRESLAGRFRSPRQRPSEHAPVDQPPVEELLDVDEEYRRRARRGELPRITPRRFNPTLAAWLPILHTTRDERHYTALFSNTARAHELGMTHDWVVIYRDDHDGQGQWTVITSQLGALKGQRIVRGREKDCADYYAH